MVTSQVITKPITAEEVAAFEAQGLVREIVDGKWVGSGEEYMANPAVQVKPITAEEVAAFEAQGLVREIVNGVWVEENELPFKGHALIGANIVGHLFMFLQNHRIGRVYQDQTNYVLKGEPGNIEVMRIPDVSFVSNERVDPDLQSYYFGAPDLAVEIISSSEKPHEIADKLADYLQYGVKQVWQVYPEQKQVIVHFPQGEPRVYGIDDVLRGGDVLPNFELPVRKIFE